MVDRFGKTLANGAWIDARALMEYKNAMMNDFMDFLKDHATFDGNIATFADLVVKEA